MNDPHVEKLYYRFLSENPTDLFEKTKPLALSLGSFDINMQDNLVVAIPHDHFSDEESAKASLEPFLRSWESSAFLSQSKFRIRFKFEQADVIDRKPSPNQVSIYARGIVSEEMFGKPTVIHHINKYPEPDVNFVASPLTDELIFRLQQYKDGRQSLPHVAYYVLDKLEQEFGLDGEKKKAKRKRLAKQLSIEFTVVDTIGNLSNRADVKIGRHASHHNAPLTNRELIWLEEAVFRLVRRIGEANAVSQTLPNIRMSDFPLLK